MIPNNLVHEHPFATVSATVTGLVAGATQAVAYAYSTIDDLQNDPGLQDSKQAGLDAISDAETDAK